jgi:hypothetical protein
VATKSCLSMISTRCLLAALTLAVEIMPNTILLLNDFQCLPTKLCYTNWFLQKNTFYV